MDESNTVVSEISGSRSSDPCACPIDQNFTGPSLTCSSSSSCLFDCFNFANPAAGACRKYGVWEVMLDFEAGYLNSSPPSGCQRIDIIDPANCLSHFGGNYDCIVFKSCEIFYEDLPDNDPAPESVSNPFFNGVDLCDLLNGRLAKFIECYQSQESINDCSHNGSCNLMYYPILDFQQVQPPCGPCETGNPYDVWMTIQKVEVYCCP